MNFAMATIGIGSCKGNLQWASFFKKGICDEEELFKLQLTASQQLSTEGVSVCDMPGERKQSNKQSLFNVSCSAHYFSTKDRSHPGATIQTRW